MSAAAPAPPGAERLRNAMAGLAVAGLLIPEAIAYAGIAGLPAQHALVATVVGLLVYACVGGSRYAIVSPTSSSATLLAAAVATLTASGASAQGALMLSSALVLLVGLLFLLCAALRMGHLSAFISRPVLRGFAFGLALTIVIKQLPHITGLATPAASPLHTLWALLAGMAHWNLWSLALGGGAYIGLQLLKRIRLFPAALAVLMLGIGAALVVDLPARGVPLVGRIALGGLQWQWPALDRVVWQQAAELALPLMVILYAESWGSVRGLALRHGDAVSANRELAALGAANLCAGLCQGLPVGAGFSASSANEDAGARGKAAAVIAAIAVLALVASAGRWLALLPTPVLAAVVISALSHALTLRPLWVLCRLKRDAFLAVAAIVAVVALGVLQGMLLAVLFSIMAALRRFSDARISVLGQLQTSRDYVDTARHPQAQVLPDVLIVRPQAPLFFANAEPVLAQVRAVAERAPATRTIVLSLEESTDLDSTAVEALTEFHAWACGAGHRVLLARAKENVRDLLLRTPTPWTQDQLFWSVADAMQAAQA